MGDPRRAMYEQGGELYVGGRRAVSVGGRIGSSLLDSLLFLVTCGIGWIIWSIFAWQQGKTPAKQLLHQTCVRTDNGEVAGMGEMCIRELVIKVIVGTGFLGILSIVSLFMILGRDRMAVWDKVCDTAVVYD